jgi:hypothetical protein
MSIQLPPNSTGTVLDTNTISSKDRQIINIGDPTTGANQVTVGANGAAYMSPIDGNKTTYASALTAINVGTSATTVLAQVVGSATKTVRVTKIRVSATQSTAAVYYDLNIVKSSTAISGGTASAGTVVPLDSNDTAGTGTMQAFTATPTAGTAVGNIDAQKIFLPITGTPASGILGYYAEFGGRAASRAVVLRGVAQSCDVKIANATPANANSFDFAFEWTEE